MAGILSHDVSAQPWSMPPAAPTKTPSGGVKRPRSSGEKLYESIDIAVTSKSSEAPEQPTISQERVKKFKRLVKANKTDGILIALRSGVLPDVTDCIYVINKGHSRAALACVEALPENNRKILFAAIRRRYDPLFHAVLGRFNKFIEGLIEPLLQAPSMYLKAALEKGVTNANELVKSGRTPLEEVCVHKRIAHIDVLMRHDKTRGTTRAFRLMLRDPRQYPYMAACLKAGAPVTVDLVPVCLHLQQTLCLQFVMQSIEEKEPAIFENHIFVDIRDKLHCPILNDYTTSLAMTPKGHTYDKDSIFTWVSKNRNDPLTREELTMDLLKYGPKVVTGVRDWIVAQLKKVQEDVARKKAEDAKKE